MLNLRRLTAVLAGVSVAVGLAAASGAAAASRNVKAKTPGSVFKVMVITGLNTTENETPSLLAGVQAGANAVNKTAVKGLGGLKGHRIKVISCSPNSTPAGSAMCAREAVADKVGDVIQLDTYAGDDVPIFAAAGIPHIGTEETGTSQEANGKLWYPLIPDSLPEGVAALYYTMKHNPSVKKWAAITVNAPASALNIAPVASLVPRLGGTWLGTTFVTGLDVDLSVPVAKLQAEGAQGVYVLTNPSQAQAFTTAAAGLGYDPDIIGVSPTFPATNVAGFPNGGKNLVIGAETPPLNSPLPGVKKWLADMKAAHVATTANETPDGVTGWLAMWALQKLSQRIKGAVTKASLIAELHKVGAKNPINLFGLVTWEPGVKGPESELAPHLAVADVWVLGFANGGYKLLSSKPSDAWTELGVS